ncbi:hypothetical protein GP486_004972 [Trichoglossum hirsutum]|uniref:Uncharacterized protein n=1 Tax=Trichoglossum hirsutum TaxID=265104 RepID=A0A9P8L9Z8_9PEZI|nr:hypothetical protein GP486_004972 [Trichoglossum hirsutum]
MTSTIPTTQAGSCPRRRKKAIEPSCGGSPGQTPAQAARRPVEPTRIKIISTTNEAIETPILRSLSVLEAKLPTEQACPQQVGGINETTINMSRRANGNDAEYDEPYNHRALDVVRNK